MDEDEYVIQQDDCLICAEKFSTIEQACETKIGRIRCVGGCIHCSNLCSICMLRIRVLQHSKKCPACTADLPIIICTDRIDASLSDYNIWGDNIGPDFSFDSRSSIFYPNEYYKKVILPLWLWKCNVCNITKRDAKGLRIHVINEHNLNICNLCVEFKLGFPIETKIYNQLQYDIHLKKGDNDGSLGHPSCEFCRIRFFDKTLLFQHLSKDHYTCHICEKDGIQFKYYQDYNKLENHFRAEHFICEEKNCLEKKFIAFSSQIELHSHTMKWHPLLLNGFRSLPLHFKVKNNSSNSLNSNNSDSYLINDDNYNNNNNNVNRKNRDNAYDSGIRGRVKAGEWQIEIEDLQQLNIGNSNNNNNNNQSNVNQGRLISGSSSDNLLDDEYPSLIGSDRQISASWVAPSSTVVKEDFPVLGGGSSNSTSLSWLSSKKGSQKAIKSKPNKSDSQKNSYDFKEALNPSLSVGIQMHMGLIQTYPNQNSDSDTQIVDKKKDENSTINEYEKSTVQKDNNVKKMKIVKSKKNSTTGWDEAFKSTGLISNKNKKPTGFSVFKVNSLPNSGYKKETLREEDNSIASLDLTTLKPAGKFANNEEPVPIKKVTSEKKTSSSGLNLLTSTEAISINTPNTPKAGGLTVTSPRANIQVIPPAPPVVAPPPGFEKFPLTEGAPPPGFEVFPIGVVPPTTATLSRPSSATNKAIKPPQPPKNDKSNDNRPIIRNGDSWVHIGGTSESRINKLQAQPTIAVDDPDFPSLPKPIIEAKKVQIINKKIEEKSKKNKNSNKNIDLKSLAFIKK